MSGATHKSFSYEKVKNNCEKPFSLNFRLTVVVVGGYIVHIYLTESVRIVVSVSNVTSL